MTMPSLEDMDAKLDNACMAVLGDSIRYQKAGASEFVMVKAYVDHGDGTRSLDVGQTIEQEATVEVLESLVGEKPSDATRIQLPKAPGKTFKPINVRRNESGTHWLFELKKVAA